MQNQTQVSFDFPFPDEQVFRYASMADILHHLVNNPYEGFTMQRLADITGYDKSTIYRSVDLLQKLGVVTKSDERPSRVSIEQNHIECDNPLLLIPQEEFRHPIQAYLDELRGRINEEERIEELVSVVLFGSVARGEADRASDVDVLVIIAGSKTHGRRVSNAVAREIEDERFDGDRYEFEVLVETVDSARRAGESLTEIFDEGLVLHRSAGLDQVRDAVYQDEEDSTDAN